MKIALPVAFVAFILGCVAGVMVEKRRAVASAAPVVAGAPVPSGSPATPEDTARYEEAEKRATAASADLAKAKATIAKLELALGKAPPKDGETKVALTPEEAKAKLEELRARIPDLVAKKDGKALVKLMQDLAALGEVGYMAAIEVSGIIAQDVEGGKNELGLSRNEFYMSFSGPMIPVQVWAMQKGDEIPAGFRAGAAWGLAWRPEVEPGKLFLDTLKTEKSKDVIAAIAQNLEQVSKEGMEADLAALVPQFADNSKMLGSLVDSLIKIGSPEALASVESLLHSPNDAIRTEAEIGMIAIRPPAQGIMITMTVPNSQAENVGIKRGDIITSYNGTTVADFEALQEQMQSASPGAVVTITVNRKGELIPLQIKAGAKIGIIPKDVKPK
ncbi:MAG: PDZ domain-containing protein [Planctomycetes bacterium]|nr:PDZ domain-containing protein [Planctomycetota bacterium]